MGGTTMQPRVVLDTLTILIPAIGWAFVTWVAISIITSWVILIIIFSRPDLIDATLMKHGIAEVIVGGEYVLATGFHIWNVHARNRPFLLFLMGVSIAIATSGYQLLNGLFVLSLFLGSVAIWYQITLIQRREATTAR